MALRVVEGSCGGGEACVGVGEGVVDGLGGDLGGTGCRWCC